VSPPELVESYLAWSELMVSETQMVRPLLDRFMGDEAKAFLDLTNAGFPEPTPASLLQMHQSRHRISKAWRSFLNHYPVIIGPTWTQPPFSLGFDIESQSVGLRGS
jgi:amidase